MIIKNFLPLIATTVALNGFAGVEALPSKRPIRHSNTTVSQPVQSSWKIFTAPDGRFTVLMPGTPKMMTQTQKTYMGEIDLQVFVAQPPKQEVVYLVAYNDFPHSYGQMANPQEILKNAQDMALKTTQSHLVSQCNIRSSNGHPGREIVYVNPGGKITKDRMYFANGRLYQVMAITTKKQQKTLSQTIAGYLNSFHVVLKPSESS
jgi:hypothetical protein